MSNYPNPNYYGSARPQPLDYAPPSNVAAVASFFNVVYAWMARGLAVTGLVAWLVAQTEECLDRSLGGGVLIGLFIATIVLAVVIGNATQRIGPGLATLLFMV